MAKGWIGVDLDGTLSEKVLGRHQPEVIGTPVAKMVVRVREGLQAKKDIRIFTARCWAPPDDAERQRYAAIATLAIQAWCEDNLGEVLPVTCTKDPAMVELWDDRAVQVAQDTGERVDGKD